MKKILLKSAVLSLALLSGGSALATVGDVTTVMDVNFENANLTDNSVITWGADIQGMITSQGIYVTNQSNKSNNYENRDFITFANPVGNETHEVSFQSYVTSTKDKGQNPTYYTISFFDVNNNLIFGIQEYSGGWAYGANVIAANEDGTTTATALAAGHMSKGGGSNINFNLTFADGSALVSIDGATVSAYCPTPGIKYIKLSCTGENGYDRDMYIHNMVIRTTEIEAVQTAEYKLQYVCDGVVLKEETLSGVVGSEIALTSTQTADFVLDGVKYIFAGDDAEGQTIAADGSTVVTLTYRTAATFTYKVTNNVNNDVVTGTCLEGNSVTVPYKRYLLDAEGDMYIKDATNKEYNVTFTPDQDNYSVALNYAASDYADVIYLSEAEDIEGMETVTRDNANVRCSNAAGGYADAAVEITTLAPGKYKVGMGVWGNAGATFVVKAGEATVLTAETQGWWFESVSEEFTLEANTVITFEGATNNKPLDYIFIQRTGEGGVVGIENVAVDAVADGKWYNLQGIEVAAPTQTGIYIHNGKKVMIKK